MRTKGYQTDHLKYISTGLCPNCEECMCQWGDDNINDFNDRVESGDIADEGSFSWQPCDECNTNLGGNSYVAHGIDLTYNYGLVHFTVCHDCLFEMSGYTWNKEDQCWDI